MPGRESMGSFLLEIFSVNTYRGSPHGYHEWSGTGRIGFGSHPPGDPLLVYLIPFRTGTRIMSPHPETLLSSLRPPISQR